MVSKKNQFLLFLASCTAFFSLMVIFLTPISNQEQQINHQKLRRGPSASRFFLGIIEPEVTVILGGDVMLGRTVMTRSLDLSDPAYPFTKVADELKAVDIVFVNLENPIVENCPRKSGGMIFCADPKMVEGLTFAGIDVVTLANNHSRNYGQVGLEYTKNILEKNGILSTDSNLVIRYVNGVSVGFLGFNFVDKKISDLDINLVRDSNLKVDILIIGVHWGYEYQAQANKNQKEMAQKLVDAGADVVVGHHPHWVQESAYINSRPVYYSLGNFVFDQMWSQKTREGLLMKLTFKGEKLVIEEKMPIYMSAWAQPEFVE